MFVVFCLVGCYLSKCPEFCTSNCTTIHLPTALSCFGYLQFRRLSMFSHLFLQIDFFSYANSVRFIVFLVFAVEEFRRIEVFGCSNSSPGHIAWAELMNSNWMAAYYSLSFCLRSLSIWLAMIVRQRGEGQLWCRLQFHL